MKKSLVVVLALVVSACSIRPPPPPPPTPCGVNENRVDGVCVCDEGYERDDAGVCVKPTPPPPLNTQFDWKLTRGFSLFAGARAIESQIRNLYDVFRVKWPHLRLTPRVCGEVQSWPYVSDEETPGVPRWLPRGVSAKPFDDTSPAYQELKHFLDVAVTIPDAQVLVVPICNLKGDGTSPANRLKWVRNVCRLVGSERTDGKRSYPNVAIEIVNEYIHPGSNMTTDEMKLLIRACRIETPASQIGTDTNINKIRREYEPELVGLVDFFSYHPWRNPDPTQQDLRAIVREWIGGTVFSETTAYAHPRWGRLGGCCTGDKEQIDDYARHAEKAGGVFFYHMVWGLCWPEKQCPIGYILPRGDWEIRHGR